MAKPGNGQGIGDAVIDPGAEKASAGTPVVTPKDEEDFYTRSALAHKLEMQRLEQGTLGKFFGSGAKAGTNVAGLLSLIALFLIALTFVIKVEDPGTLRTAMLTIITSSLGYIFGASTKKD